ncbi:MAG: DUF2244 domain-containing protein [Burkholderiales bacterium]|nr:DUF2244 domain-containing protein [Burkholderiales bacterium]MDE2395831.1 DUF2244 domain-containing protein [Burkholderiales bacterium]MDE2455541.1 DUF2244 domain-containing protein [Burkholderiales bacterium]
MAFVFAPRPWPAPAAEPAAWRFERGQEVEDEGHSGEVLRWVLAPNCSISPRQLGACYLALCLITLAIAGGFWWQGAGMISAFAGVELVAVGAALLVHARHTGDREVITLSAARLVVEQHTALRVERHELGTEWLHIQAAGNEADALIDLAARGRHVRIGRHLRPDKRAALVIDLRRALRQVHDQTRTRTEIE